MIMKRFVLVLLISVMANAFTPVCNAVCSSTFHIHVTLQQFKESSAQEQLEVIRVLLRKAESAYKAGETIEEMYELREKMQIIELYMTSARQSFTSEKMDYNLLYNRLNKTIREYENGVTVYEEAGGYEDFGQELD